MKHCWPYLLLILLLSLPLEAATIYRSVDDQGNVVFSETPREGSEPIDPDPISVVPSVEPWVEDDSIAETADSASKAADDEVYKRFEIVSPANEQTLPTGQAGDVKVVLGIEPALRESHRVRLRLDGAIAATAQRDGVFALSGLHRGEHLLQAELLDADGEVRQRSEAVTLYVQRASVNLPANPNNPAGRPPSQTGH